tara:strand:+ start:1007 stop:1162 length:156 start_codon:yes stop_codon:yes gene_type:complete
VADKNFIKIIILLISGTIAAIAFTFYSTNLQSKIEYFDKNVSKILKRVIRE